MKEAIPILREELHRTIAEDRVLLWCSRGIGTFVSDNELEGKLRKEASLLHRELVYANDLSSPDFVDAFVDYAMHYHQQRKREYFRHLFDSPH